MTLPMALTWSRILCIPVFVMFFYSPYEWGRMASAAVFLLIGVTDWLDGYLARKWDQMTPFGAFLDPVADKLTVLVALIILLQADPSWLLTLAVAVIIGREVTISSLREWMAGQGKTGVMAVSWVGKWKTFAQMSALTWMLFKAPLFGLPVYDIGLVFLSIALVLTLWSMLGYMKVVKDNLD